MSLKRESEPNFPPFLAPVENRLKSKVQNLQQHQNIETSIYERHNKMQHTGNQLRSTAFYHNYDIRVTQNYKILISLPILTLVKIVLVLQNCLKSFIQMIEYVGFISNQCLQFLSFCYHQGFKELEYEKEKKVSYVLILRI